MCVQLVDQPRELRFEVSRLALLRAQLLLDRVVLGVHLRAADERLRGPLGTESLSLRHGLRRCVRGSGHPLEFLDLLSKPIALIGRGAQLAAPTGLGLLEREARGATEAHVLRLACRGCRHM